MKEKSRIRVRKLGLGEAPDEGAFYAQVDGENVGTDGRAFWDTKAEAYRCGVKNLTAKIA